MTQSDETETASKTAPHQQYSNQFNAELGKRILCIIHSHKDVNSNIEELEKICQSHQYTQSIKDMILEWAYAGCIGSSLSGKGDPLPRLKKYISDIKQVLEQDRFEDPAIYVPKIYNGAFKQ